MDLHFIGISIVMGILFTLCTLSSSLEMPITRSPKDQGQKKFWRSLEEMKWMYEEWIVNHDKSYNNGLEEKEERFEIFKDNLQFIDEHNLYSNDSYVLGLNHFADLTHEEFVSLYLSDYTNVTRPLSLPFSDRYVYKDGDNMPNCIDWRSKGAVTLVKDQGRCKSCWVFSVVAAIEGINYITNGELITLSEQQILDCEMWGTGCCKTGYTLDAYEFVTMNGGVAADDIYPYHKRKEKCMWDIESAASITGYEFISKDSEMSLQKAVANQPISVVVGAKCKGFQFYKSGIYDGGCGNEVRHSVAVIGYGTEDGNDYWIVKNSWGERWGESGYMRMERGAEEPEGRCGIAAFATYPVMRVAPSL